MAKLEINIKYENFLKNLSSYINDTLSLYNKKEVERFKKKLFQVKRIFFTGTGSSIPGAMFGAQYCASLGLPAQFLSNGGILGMKFNKNDLVFLNTQGFNRGDAELIAKKVKNDGGIFAVLTANKETPLLSLADFVFLFSPFPEKLFSRPVGVQTAIIALAKILMPKIKKAEIVKAIKKGNSKPKVIFNKKTRYVVLSSGVGMPIAINYSLALREGCGIDSQVYDVETYGHGMYVSDQALKYQGYDVQYILINLLEDYHVQASINRIKPFIKNSKCKLLEVKSNLNIIYAYIEQLTFLARCVLETNKLNSYDMNEPFGKEENRYYHKAETYKISELKLKDFIKKIKESRSKKNNRVLIEISGGSCVGKSTYVKRIKNEFSSVEVIPQDAYQIGKNFKYKKSSRYKFDDLRNFQIKRCYSDLKRLLSGKEIVRPNFNLKENISKGKELVHPKDIIILEGIYAFYSPLDLLSKFRIYIETPYYLRFLRRIARFVNNEQNRDLSIPLKHITGPVYLAHKDFVIKQRESADLVIQSKEVLPVFKKTFEKEFEHIKIKECLFKKEDVEICIGSKSNKKYLCIFQREKCCYLAQINRKILNFLNKINWLEK